MIGALAPPRPAHPVSTILVLAGRSLRQLRRSPGMLVGIALSPLVTLFAFGVLFANMSSSTPGTGQLAYVMPGAAMQVGLAGIGPTAVDIAVDRRSGLLDRLRSLPVSGTAVLVGHTFARLLVGLIGIAAVTVAGLVMGWRSNAALPYTLAGYGLVIGFVYAMVWLGVALGLSVRTPATLNFIAALSSVIFSFFSTAFLPANILPPWLALIADGNPLSKVASTCRALWSSHPEDARNTIALTAVVLSAGLAALVSFSMRAFRTTSASR